MRNIKCLACDKLLCKSVTNNLFISHSSDLVMQTEYNNFQAESILEIKCNGCKSYMSIFNSRGEVKWLKKLLILYQQKQSIQNGD